MKTRAEIKALAKAQLKGNLLMLIVCSIIVGAITGALSFTGIGPILVTGWFTFVTARFYLGMIDGKKVEIGGLFEGLNGASFVRTLIAGLLHSLFIVLWSMLLVIPGIIKSYSYAMTYYIMNDDPTISGNDAITASRKLMNGHKLELFVLDLSFILWYLLVAVTFGLAGLYVGPYVSATKANFYRNLKTNSTAA